MARFVDDTIGPPMPAGTAPIPIPTPAPRAAQLVEATVPGRGPPGYGHNMTLAALMARQKDLAEAQNAQMQTGGGGTIMGGFGSLANIFVDALNERRTRKAEEEGNAEVAEAWKSYDPATGMLSPEAMEVLMRRNPDAGQDLYKTAMALRASQAKQEDYTMLTADEAKALGLDATKPWQRSKLTNKVSAVGGEGTVINTGTDSKIPDWAAEDAKFYMQGSQANMDLEDWDTELTSTPNSLAQFVTGSTYLNSAQYKMAAAAGDSWIMSVLRPESGGVIGEEEMAQHRQTYLPQPGDDKATIEYKRQLRAQKTENAAFGLKAIAPNTWADIQTTLKAEREARAKRRQDAAAAGTTEPPADAGDGTTPPAADAGTTEAPGTLPYPDMPQNWPADKGWPDAATWKRMSQPDQQAFLDAAKSNPRVVQ